MSSSYGNKVARWLISTRGTLKACKNVKFSFNPWQVETKSIRNVYHYLSSPKMRMTNEKCRVVADVRSDLSDPVMEVVFLDDTKAVFKTKALTSGDIVKEFNRLTTQKLPAEEATSQQY